ncbi:hypothetical protein [Streptomyces sp. MK5]|uniref:hypothetical protein n=1 Tax=Streptomyces sp. MK5 TaxID=3064253 RepID=UPI0027414EF1|nr:hypothetical protein [Streptomyces sp. MK5]
MGEEKPTSQMTAEMSEIAETRETPETPETPSAPPGGSSSRRPDRAALITAGAVLAACAGLVLYGVLGTGNGDGQAKQPPTPTAPVTYEVTGTGTADLTYQARDETGKATVVRHAHLPWHTTVDVPLGQNPTISIVLDQHGGTARCSLAIRGQNIQSATAAGTFGRATCSATLPRPDAS